MNLKSTRLEDPLLDRSTGVNRARLGALLYIPNREVSIHVTKHFTFHGRKLHIKIINRHSVKEAAVQCPSDVR